MKVSDLMTRALITIRPDDSVEVAVQLLRQRGVRHLLVLKNARLVGIISDRDIKRALDPERTRKKLLGIGGLYFLLEPIFVHEIMTPNPVTIQPNVPIQEAASVMVAERFGALPVVRGNELVGIITETDLLRYFAKAASGDKPAKAEGSAKAKRPAKREAKKK
jgi:acetoin utilization protein AcuB